jgi:tetratricopeptide (TPR) repeat protein
MQRTALIIGAAMAAASLAASAQAYVYVAAGGNAAACYQHAVNQNNTMEAVSTCTAALTADQLNARDRAATLVNRGILQLRMGRHDRAMNDFDQAIAAEPALAEGYINRGAALLRQENYGEAIAAISAGLERRPADPAQAHYNRAVAHEESGNVRAAYEDYRRAAELAPNWEAPRLELARFSVRR